MVSDELPGRLEALVDYLRSRKEQRHVSLAEIASVTEVLIATMTSYFRSIDTSIYREFRFLSDYINRARDEISQLHPTELKTRQIPRAGRELDAIVAATEEATNTIMEAAETIMAADASDPDAYAQTVNDSVMAIFEACSFQDITGQRISKVVETLSVIEQRLNRLGDVLGVGHEEPVEEEPASSEDDPGVSGPALAGEGIDQEGVDALLSGNQAASASSEPETAESAADPEAEPAEDDAELSDEDIDRLMGTSGAAPANDIHPLSSPENRTAEQLVRAVEAILSEEDDVAVSEADEMAAQETGEIEDAESEEADSDEEASFEEPDAYPREATNDQVDMTAARQNGAKSADAPTDDQGRTTQADIDALFS